MQLLGDVPLERDGRHVDRVDARKGQKIGSRERVALTDRIGGQRDIEEEGLELSIGQGCRDAVAVASAVTFWRSARALDLERELVISSERGGFDQRVQRVPLRMRASRCRHRGSLGRAPRVSGRARSHR
jgi:hypothetical protein